MSLPFSPSLVPFLIVPLLILGNLAHIVLFQYLSLLLDSERETLAGEAGRHENLASNLGSNEWPAPPPPVQQPREPFLRSFLRAIGRSPKADTRSQALSGIYTTSECSLVSSCTGNHSSDSEEDLIYEKHREQRKSFRSCKWKRRFC